MENVPDGSHTRSRPWRAHVYRNPHHQASRNPAQQPKFEDVDAWRLSEAHEGIDEGPAASRHQRPFSSRVTESQRLSLEHPCRGGPVRPFHRSSRIRSNGALFFGLAGSLLVFWSRRAFLKFLRGFWSRLFFFRVFLVTAGFFSYACFFFVF